MHAKPHRIRSACQAMASWMFGTFLANMKPAYEAPAFNLDLSESAFLAFWGSQQRGLGRRKVRRTSHETPFPVLAEPSGYRFRRQRRHGFWEVVFAATTFVAQHLPGPKLKQVWVDIEHKCWETLLLSAWMLTCCSFSQLLLRTIAY